MSFGRLVQLVWSRKLTFLSVFLLIVVGVAAYCTLATPVFQSEALVMVSLDRSQSQQPQFPDTLRYRVNSEMYVIESEDALKQAVDAVGAEKLLPSASNPFLSALKKRLGYAGDLRSDRERALAQAKKQLTVTPEKDSQILRLTFRNENPAVAARFLSHVIDTFLQRQADLTGSAAAPSFFRKQAEQYRADYVKASAKLAEFAKAHSTYSIKQEIELALERRDDTLAALAKTRGSISEKEAEATDLQNTLTQLRRRISLPGEITGPKYNVPAAKNNAPAAKNNVPAASDDFLNDKRIPANESPLLLVRVFQESAQSLVNINSTIVGLRALEKSQSEALSQVEKTLNTLSADESEFRQLTDEVDQASKILEAHVGRAADAQMNADWDASEKLSSVKVVETPTTPSEPAFPKKPLFLSLGAALGVLAGAAACVALDDRSRRRSATWKPVPIKQESAAQRQAQASRRLMG